MRFLVDAQLPPDLVIWLKSMEHEAWHVAELNLREADDVAVWAKAVELRANLITKDDDFVAIRERAASGPSVVWLRIGNAINRVLIGWLAKSWPDAIAAIGDGVGVIEIKVA